MDVKIDNRSSNQSSHPIRSSESDPPAGLMMNINNMEKKSKKT